MLQIHRRPRPKALHTTKKMPWPEVCELLRPEPEKTNTVEELDHASLWSEREEYTK